MAEVIRPNDGDEKFKKFGFSVFLAGSMGKPWRKELYTNLKNLEGVALLDPSVDDWENAIGAEDVNNPKFIKQVSWEQSMLLRATFTVFHFDETSMAPVSLLELGQHYDRKNTLIHLEPGYSKEGHVRYLAGRQSIPLVETLNEVASIIRIKANIWG